MATKSFAGINLSGHLQDDELASWMGYPIDDYCSEILSELAGLEAMDDNVNQIKSPQKPVVNFSIFSRPIIEASPKIDLAFQEKNPEKDVASSSLCSKNEPGMKRREENGETEEDLTEDQEGESTDRRPAKRQSVSKKRSRSAEIHNLSERRRRDRINEKMRILQELVPSCSKVDKASMLDEVIDYLKTLQMQVQVMSMGFMQPMMLPNGVNGNMGMGMGMGMGMVNMSSFPVMSFPTMNGHPHGFHMIMPNQMMPISMPHPSHFVPKRSPQLPSGTSMTTSAHSLSSSAFYSENSKASSSKNVKDQYL